MILRRRRRRTLRAHLTVHFHAFTTTVFSLSFLFHSHPLLRHSQRHNAPPVFLYHQSCFHLHSRAMSLFSFPFRPRQRFFFRQRIPTPRTRRGTTTISPDFAQTHRRLRRRISRAPPRGCSSDTFAFTTTTFFPGQINLLLPRRVAIERVQSRDKRHSYVLYVLALSLSLSLVLSLERRRRVKCVVRGKKFRILDAFLYLGFCIRRLTKAHSSRCGNNSLRRRG